MFTAYEQGLKDLGVTDFDGLLNRALAVKELPPKARRPFSHLLVDEFQDVNALQYELVLQWSREGSLFVIGDPDPVYLWASGGRWVTAFSGWERTSQTW